MACAGDGHDVGTDRVEERARDAEEKLSKSGDSNRGDEVDELCDRTREADGNDPPTWNGIKSRSAGLRDNASGQG